ncbi:threonine-phosphate decarboxylase CobD [Marinobacter sp.]|uniref:threonine-phosphate decarboxylase CobD n=1 Tax=Marinobacter sp. TaxID=50741 RepID=UPI001A032E4E|nr:threonine-phosphate decarboxylase CobD [Marinobacter sp.]MBE0486506.1 threonine-phosphate decarboxylase [Marinobacter sp.]
MTAFDLPESPEHGGRLQAAARQWGIPREQWLDLSTGINPVPWPVPAIPPEVWQRLPEPDDGLEETIRAWAGAPEQARCLPVAGSQAAIMALPAVRARMHGIGRVAVPVPGYREHGHAWRRAGFEVVAIPADKLETGDLAWLDCVDVVVWIQPNNPTGQLLDPARLLLWHQRLQARGSWLVLDQAFVEGEPGFGLEPWAGAPGLVLLRSLGKFFGLAGVRAGAVLAGPELIRKLAFELGPWTVSGPARYLMAKALADRAWQVETRGRLQTSRLRMDGLLRKSGMPAATGTLLFRTIYHEKAAPIAHELARRAILVRRFDEPSFLRFGLPPDESGWQRLERALSELTYLIDHPHPG